MFSEEDDEEDDFEDSAEECESEELAEDEDAEEAPAAPSADEEAEAAALADSPEDEDAEAALAAEEAPEDDPAEEPEAALLEVDFSDSEEVFFCSVSVEVELLVDWAEESAPDVGLDLEPDSEAEDEELLSVETVVVSVTFSETDVEVSVEATWLPRAAWALVAGGLLLSDVSAPPPPDEGSIGIERENVRRVITSIKPSAMRTSPIDLAISELYV